MAGQVRIKFTIPGHADPYYFLREASIVVNRRNIMRPELTLDAFQAHKFNRESAVAFRDKYRAEYRQYSIVVEDGQGNVLFERQSPVDEGEDLRKPVWVSPDSLEAQRLGLIVRPAVRPDGRCWCVRAADIPSLAGRDFETIYAKTPIEAAERALATFGALAQPYPSPMQDAEDNAEARRIISEIQRSKYGTGRRRPGDER